MNNKTLKKRQFTSLSTLLLQQKNKSLLVGALLPFLLIACASDRPAPVVNRSGSATAYAGGPRPAPGTRENGYYTVKKGDTLYSIALDSGQYYRDIAAWNNLEDPNKIYVDQVLRVDPPGKTSSNNGVAVSRPVAVGSGIETRPLDSGPLKRDPKAGKEPYSDQAYAGGKAGAGSRPATAATTATPAVVASKPNTAPANTTSDTAVPGEPVWNWPASGKVVGSFNETSNKGIDIAGKLGDPVLAASEGKVVYTGGSLPAYGQLVIIKHTNGNYLSAYAYNQKILVKEGQQVTRGMQIATMGSNDAGTRLHFEIRKQGKPVDPLPFLPSR